MKKHIILSLLLLGGAMSTVFAQNTELFRFSSVNTQNGQQALHHNLNDNSLELVPVSDATFNTTDGYLQAFILKRLSLGEVLISSAKRNNHFLYYDATSDMLQFKPISDETELSSYTWKIKFSGTEQVVISPKDIIGKGLTKNGNVISVGVLTNNALGEITNANVVGNQHRFTMDRVSNVF